jgi:molybdate transport system substrate-binding protein
MGRLLLGFAMLAVGCGPRGGEQTPAEPLRVAAASDLQAALPALGRAFKEETGLEVVFTPGASGQLARQIRQGAPFDVFLAANRRFVDDLAADGSIRRDSVRPYARGSLVLAVHESAAGTVTSLADLAKPEVKKIALANPAFAPYGAAGKQALERAGLWAGVEPKVVLAETVRQALQFVESGNAEAGLVGRAIAGVPGVRVVAVDPALYDPIIQALGVTATTKRADDAERFARFLLGESGRRILSDYGFARPDD